MVMHLMSKNEMTARLGQEPGRLDFFGQIYDAGEMNKRVCALTGVESRICLTLKPKSGKGRITISDQAIPHFERWNPDLFIKLQTGIMFLQVHTSAVIQSKQEQAEIRKMREAEQRYNEAKKMVRYRIQKHRTIHKGQLPEYLRAMRDLLQRPSPFFANDSSRTLWFEQGTIAIQTAMLNDPEAPEPVPEPVMAAAPAPIAPQPERRERLPFFEIPELDDF